MCPFARLTCPCVFDGTQIVCPCKVEDFFAHTSSQNPLSSVSRSERTFPCPSMRIAHPSKTFEKVTSLPLSLKPFPFSLRAFHYSATTIASES